MIRLALIRVLGRPLILRHTPRGNGADAIVILGCALRADGSLSGPLEERVRAGAEAYRSGLAPVVCATGGVPLGASVDRPEAHAMRTRLVELGVPETAILIEDASRSTFENASACAALLHPRGIRRVWLVTQPFHSRRAARHFRRAGFAALGFPIAGSLEERDPVWGLARVLREYVSWAKLLVLLR